MVDVQRLSPDGRVKPQANGGRKIPALTHNNMRKDVKQSTHWVMPVDTLVVSSIELRLLEKNYINIFIYINGS